VNRRALEVARHNARGLYNVDFLVGDDLDPGLRFAGIWSNPPIRIGKAALHTLLSTWLARLAPGAIAHLVVARNLGADSLQGWLIEHGWPSRRIASRSGYRVLAVESAAGAQTEEERR
jgi:16S rRNA (guanine1207-N2)-methyltransferase